MGSARTSSYVAGSALHSRVALPRSALLPYLGALQTHSGVGHPPSFQGQQPGTPADPNRAGRRSQLVPSPQSSKFSGITSRLTASAACRTTGPRAIPRPSAHRQPAIAFFHRGARQVGRVVRLGRVFRIRRGRRQPGSDRPRRSRCGRGELGRRAGLAADGVSELCSPERTHAQPARRGSWSFQAVRCVRRCRLRAAVVWELWGRRWELARDARTRPDPATGLGTAATHSGKRRFRPVGLRLRLV
mmetsp:Transcript_17978/g.42853  ORF Transcript_17978/g.42853 Transcript_17978/m.42853 type:complete len:245 (-) Transcript_17978:403-1137(-)